MDHVDRPVGQRRGRLQPRAADRVEWTRTVLRPDLLARPHRGRGATPCAPGAWPRSMRPGAGRGLRRRDRSAGRGPGGTGGFVRRIAEGVRGAPARGSSAYDMATSVALLSRGAHRRSRRRRPPARTRSPRRWPRTEVTIGNRWLSPDARRRCARGYTEAREFVEARHQAPDSTVARCTSTMSSSTTCCAPVPTRTGSSKEARCGALLEYDAERRGGAHPDAARVAWPAGSTQARTSRDALGAPEHGRPSDAAAFASSPDRDPQDPDDLLFFLLALKAERVFQRSRRRASAPRRPTPTPVQPRLKRSGRKGPAARQAAHGLRGKLNAQGDEEGGRVVAEPRPLAGMGSSCATRSTPTTTSARTSRPPTAGTTGPERELRDRHPRAQGCDLHRGSRPRRGAETWAGPGDRRHSSSPDSVPRGSAANETCNHGYTRRTSIQVVARRSVGSCLAYRPPAGGLDTAHRALGARAAPARVQSRCSTGWWPCRPTAAPARQAGLAGDSVSRGPAAKRRSGWVSPGRPPRNVGMASRYARGRRPTRYRRVASEAFGRAVEPVRFAAADARAPCVESCAGSGAATTSRLVRA